METITRTGDNTSREVCPSTENPEEPTCPDGGRGWTVAAACAVVRAAKQIIQPSFGILFGGVLASQNASNETVSWIFNIYVVLEQCSKFLVGPLGDVLGWRAVVMLSGFVCFLSCIALMYATSAVYLMLFFSVMIGTGCGLAAATCQVVISSYFDKRRGKAQAIMLFGVCFGQSISPISITFSMEHIGYKHTILIIAFFMLSICGSGYQMRPVNWRKSKDIEAHGETGNGNVHTTIDSTNNNISNGTTEEKKNCDIRLVEKILKVFKAVLHALLDNFKAMRSLKVVLLSLSVSSYMTGYLNFQMLIPFLMENKEFSMKQSAYCIAIVAAFSGISRVVTPILSDYKFFNKMLVYRVGLLGLGVSQYAFYLQTLKTSLWNMRVAAAAVGIFTGINNGLYTLVMMDELGIKLFKASYGISGILIALIAIAVGPMIGVAKDNSASYDTSMIICSVVVLSGFIFTIILPAINKLKAFSQTHTITN